MADIDKNDIDEWKAYPQTRLYLKRLEEAILTNRASYENAENWEAFKEMKGISIGIRKAILTAIEL